MAFPEMWYLKTPGEQFGAKAIQHYPLAGMPARRPGDHLVLVLDNSGSMQGPMPQPNPESHDPESHTRLRAVHLAIDALLAQRGIAVHSQGKELHPDRISAVAFGSTARNDGEGMTVRQAAGAVAAWNSTQDLGGTNYKAGLDMASSAISSVKARDPSLRPFLVFLSDGGPNSPFFGNAEIAQIASAGKADGMRMLFVLCGSDAEGSGALRGLAAQATGALGCSPAVDCPGFEGPFVCTHTGCGAVPHYDATRAQHTAHMQTHGAGHVCTEACLAVFKPTPAGTHACTAVGCPFTAASAADLLAHERLHTRVVFMQAGTVKDLVSSFKSAKASESKATKDIIDGIVQGLTQQVLKATQSVIMDNF